MKNMQKYILSIAILLPLVFAKNFAMANDLSGCKKDEILNLGKAGYNKNEIAEMCKPGFMGASHESSSKVKSYWVVSNTDEQHYFERRDRGWVEVYKDDKVEFIFEEKQSSKEYVELHDSTRGVKVRLYDHKYKWKTDGYKVWSGGKSGGWKKKGG